MKTFTIAGTDQTARQLAKSLSLTWELGKRGNATFELLSSDSWRPTRGQEVILRDTNNVRCFAGTIVESTESFFNGTNLRKILVDCSDMSEKMDRRLVAGTFLNLQAGDIVKAIIAEYMTGSGISTTDVSVDGELMVKATFNYSTVNDSIDQLCEETGNIFYVDEDSHLHFHAQATYESPFVLDDTLWSTLSVRKGKEDYRNRQYILGGYETSYAQTEDFLYGESDTFTVGRGVAEQPRIWIGSTEVLPAFIGVKGLHPNRPFQWGYDETTIEYVRDAKDNIVPNSQKYGTGDEADIVVSVDYHYDLVAADGLTPASLVVIEYKGRFPVFVMMQDDAEIAARAAVEGGSGVYDNLATQEDVDSTLRCESVAVAMLRRYGHLMDEITFTTLQKVRPGMIMSVNLPDLGIVSSFPTGGYLVSSVSGRETGRVENDEVVLEYTVKAVSGEPIGGWVDFFKALMDGLRHSVDDSDVHLLRKVTETIALSEAYLKRYQGAPILWVDREDGVEATKSWIGFVELVP